MALRYPSTSDLRLFVGGRPVHGETPEARTLRSMERTATQHLYDRTVIGDSDTRHAYLRRGGARFAVSGYWDEEHGLHPVIDAGAPPGGSNDGLPVTFSANGPGAGTKSTVAQHGIWTGETISSPAGEPVMVEAECELSNYATALCIGEARVTGGPMPTLGGLTLRGPDITVRQTVPVLQEVAGQNQFQFQVSERDAVRYLSEDEAIEFPGSQIPGIFYIANIVHGPVWSNVFVERRPVVSLAGFNAGQRNSVRNLAVVSTQRGARAAVVHLADLAMQDRVRLDVIVQGQEAGSNAWTAVVPGQNIDVAAPADAAFRRGIWFDIPDGTHSTTAVRVQLRFANAAGVLGARLDYAASVRADFVTRVVD